MSTEDNQIVEDVVADVATEEAEAEEAVEEAVEEAIEPPTPAPKRRGRPAGVKNRVKIAVVALEDDEPQPILVREPTAKPRPTAKRKPKAEPSPPQPPPPVDTSVLILNALREHQQQRAARKSAKYASWFA